MDKNEKKYLLTAVFSGNTPPEKIKQIIDGLKQKLAASNGKVSDEREPNKKRLAYGINKEPEGIYWSLCFGASPEVIIDLGQAIRIEPAIIRHLITIQKSAQLKPIKGEAKDAFNLDIVDRIDPLIKEMRRTMPKPESPAPAQEPEQTEKPAEPKTKIEDIDKKLDEILNQ